MTTEEMRQACLEGMLRRGVAKKCRNCGAINGMFDAPCWNCHWLDSKDQNEHSIPNHPNDPQFPGSMNYGG